MRQSGCSSGLESALTEFVHAAADCLQAEIEGGAEVELELGAQRGRGGAQTPFYSCRPLTGRFIAERELQLARVPEHAVAISALAEFDGLDRYLAGRGSARAAALPKGRDGAGTRTSAPTRAQSALKLLLEDVFAEQTDFDRSTLSQHPERLAAALARLERAELTGAPDTVTLVATLHGLTIASAELKLTKGLTIATPEALRWAPEQALAGIDDSESGHLLVALTCEDPAARADYAGAGGAEGAFADGSREQAAIARGREVLRDLLRALRLFGDGRVTLGPLAWARAGGEDAWSTVALGAGGRPHGMLLVSAEQEDELRAFCNLVSRRATHSNELAWALRRFELGCERVSAYEALSDHLLALRALLEPEGPSSGLLAGRIAALCATPQDRAKLTKRMTKAQALEHATIAGTAAEHAAGLNLAGDVADHLRALLRDVICGHLDPNLALLADELLAAPAEDESSEQIRGDPSETREVMDVLV